MGSFGNLSNRLATEIFKVALNIGEGISHEYKCLLKLSPI